jgi:hypothetical protein
MVLGSETEGELIMFTLSHTRLLTLAAVGAFAAIALSAPARAEDPLTNMGPVGPHEPILASVGNKRVVAFFIPDNGRCAFQAVVWDQSNDTNASTQAGQVRVNLKAHQTVQIDGDQNQSLNLQCGANAETLAAVSAQIAFNPTRND